GFRPTTSDTSLPGTPDIVFPSRRKVILVHGCFWHGHTCPRGARVPKTNTAYWVDKVLRNRRRDRKVLRDLRGLGWNILVIWECQIRQDTPLQRRLARFLRTARSRRAE